MNSGLGWKKIIYYISGSLIVLVIGAVCFIKFDTKAAANFTDSVLRPFLGDARVIALEKIFFNTSDRLNQLKYKVSKPESPFLNDGIALLPLADDASSVSLNFAEVPTTATPVLDGEGQWHNLPLDLFAGHVVLADTFIRPDPVRSYAFVTLVQVDMSKLKLWSVAGTKEPGGKVGKPGPGIIPQSVQGKGELVAAFDGGFQYKDGQYGMIVGDTTYVPLKNDLATLVGYKDGRIKIVKYEGQTFGSDVAFVRQNCPMLIENGVVAADNDANKKLWGRTLTSDIYTWRSGIGITAHGNLIYAVGNSLVPSTLASALRSAGAVNAMQLDINPYWVRFNIFDHFASDSYSTFSIMQGIQDGSYSYLHGYSKDFFYITKK